MKLEIKNLIKKFSGQQALNIDYALVPDCQTLVLIGPSGSGKSTLLRLLEGLQKPDSGSIYLNEYEIDYEDEALINHRRKIGVVFQSWNLFPHLTALENIMLPLQHVHHLTFEEARERSLTLLKRFELDKHADKKPFALSGGQSQRVALIRAIAIQPQLLMLDEPTSALDPLMTAEVLELIQELKNEHRDIILITHHLHFAKRTADRVLFICEGKILENGSSEQVFENPQSIPAKQYMTKVKNY